MKKGVSLIIATVLMIMITIAAATAAFYWLNNLQADMQSGAERSQDELMEQATGELILEVSDYNPLLDSFKIILKNSGNRDLKDIGSAGDVVTFYTESDSCSLEFNSSFCDVCPFDLGAGGVQVINLDIGGTNCQNLKLGADYNLYISSKNAQTYSSFMVDTSKNYWTRKSPSSSPSARSGHAMATIDGTDQILLFGGYDNSGNCDGSGRSYCNGTWVYDLSNNSWDNKAPASGPSSRFRHALATIYGTDKVLLFGGDDDSGNCDSSGTNKCNATWVYDLSDNAWTQMTTPLALIARQNHAIAGINGTDKVLLFGGNTSSASCDNSGGTLCNGTWVYDLSDDTWTQMTTPVSLAARWGNRLATLYNNDEIVLSGGEGATGVKLGGTWIYDLSDDGWVSKEPFSTVSGRGNHAIAVIDKTDKIALFGGEDLLANNDVWVYDMNGNTWMKRDPAGSIPTARLEHAIANIDGTSKFLLFGGLDSNGNWLSDTWIYQ